MKKQQIPIAEGLPMIQEMVKSVAIAAELGKTGPWIHNRKNHNTISGKELHFSEKDIADINSALCEIGKRLLSLVIIYSDDRDEVIAQMRNLSTIVRFTYIFCKKMGKSELWHRNRMSKKSSEGKRSSFSSADVLLVNKEVVEIANTLLSIELKM